jgi:hypothetical protein
MFIHSFIYFDSDSESEQSRDAASKRTEALRGDTGDVPTWRKDSRQNVQYSCRERLWNSVGMGSKELPGIGGVHFAGMATDLGIDAG